MTLRADGRHVISVTMLPELYHKTRAAAALDDKPISVWVREVIKEELEQQEKRNQ
jgi:hypothetical protein